MACKELAGLVAADLVVLRKRVEAQEHRLEDVAPGVLAAWRSRVATEAPSHLRRHADELTVTLLAAYLYCRRREIIDALVDLLITTVQRINARADTMVTSEFVAELKRVSGKENILFKMTGAGRVAEVQRAGSGEVFQLSDGEPVAPGRIVVARPVSVGGVQGAGAGLLLAGLGVGTGGAGVEHGPHARGGAEGGLGGLDEVEGVGGVAGGVGLDGHVDRGSRKRLDPHTRRDQVVQIQLARKLGLAMPACTIMRLDVREASHAGTSTTVGLDAVDNCESPGSCRVRPS